MTSNSGEDPMSTITTKDGTQIYYKDWGKGPVVTFSHGWPLNSDAWDGQMLFLAQNGFRVVAHDRRGHGRSSQASSGNDMNGYADDLAAVIEALELREATLVGHSTGGGEVARYIARHGTKRVLKAVLLAAVPPLMLKTPANPEGLPMEGVRRPAKRHPERPLAVLQGPGDTLLRREQAWGESLPGHSQSVLALEHAGRPQERLRKHQGIFRNRPD
jgi:pimeloyl-ACP methyl ester carboxylesterase